jgi:hypothetical protein
MAGAEPPRDPGPRPPLEPALEALRLRLAGDLGAVLGAVQALDQLQADWKAAAERWSVGEVVHHLVLSNQAFARVVRLLVHRGRHQGLTAVLGSRRSWPRLRAVADVRASGPVANPVPVTPTHGLPFDVLRRDLVASHASVTAQLPDLSGLELAALHLPHPLGFELNLYQWADIAGAHERRHLAQIEAITADPHFPSRA